MNDGFKFVTERVTAAAQAFRARKETPKQLAAPLDQSGPGLQTGDASLDGTTRDIATQITTLLRQYSDCIEAEAFALEWTVAVYRTAQEAEAEEFEELGQDPALRRGRPTAGTAAPGGGRDYGSALNPGS